MPWEAVPGHRRAAGARSTRTSCTPRRTWCVGRGVVRGRAPRRPAAGGHQPPDAGEPAGLLAASRAVLQPAGRVAGLEGPRPGLRQGRRGHRADPARGASCWSAGPGCRTRSRCPAASTPSATGPPRRTPGAVPTVLFVGRLDQEKRVDELIRAFAALPADAAGRAGDRRRRRRGATSGPRWPRDLGLADRVRFRGFVSEEELLRPTPRAAVFCMPSDRRAAEPRHPGGDGRRHPGGRRGRDGAAAPGPPRPQRLAATSPATSPS